jgi:hypothetical protein
MAAKRPLKTKTDAAVLASANTQLCLACKSANPSLAEEAIALGADPSHFDAAGNPPLYWAVRSDSPECAKLLVLAGAKKNWSRAMPGHHSQSAKVDLASTCFSISCGPRAQDVARILMAEGYAKFKSGSGERAIDSPHLTYPALLFLLDEAGVDPASASLTAWASRENALIFKELLLRVGAAAKQPNRLAFYAIETGRAENLRLIAETFRPHFESTHWRVEHDDTQDDFVRFILHSARSFRAREARIFDTLDAFASAAPDACRKQIQSEIQSSRENRSTAGHSTHEANALQAALERIELGFHNAPAPDAKIPRAPRKKASRL